MRKTPPKLALRKEALRALSGMDLVRARGGQDAAADLLGGVTDANACALAAAHNP